jgi:rhodanese-related sulfurtransferase
MSMTEITAPEAAELLAGNPDDYLLVDVREPVELEIASLAAAIHIPMGEITQRIAELDRNKTIICLCKSGGRSAQVGQYLVQQGFDRVINLAGGINAWSEQVDDSVALY